jgi:hypothetical protein
VSKVARVAEERGLDDVGDRMEALWLGTGDEQRSLRELADWFNRRVLEAALEAADETYVRGEVENTYELLAGDDVSSGDRTEIETRLRQQGVDVDALRDSFVSHQSVYTYLTDHRGVSRSEETDDRSQIEKTDDAIGRLVSRTESVVRNNLENLRDTGRIALGSFTVFVDVQVFCRDCGRQYGVEDLLAEGGCDCEADGENE